MPRRTFILLAIALPLGVAAESSLADNWSVDGYVDVHAEALNGPDNYYIPTAVDDRTVVATPDATGTYRVNTGASSRGNVDYLNPFTGVPYRAPSPQAADSSGYVIGTVGGLRGVVGADLSVSDFLNYGGHPVVTQSYANAYTSWTDTVTFHTSNPLGSDFTFVDALVDSLSTSLAPSLVSNTYPLYPEKTNATAYAAATLRYSTSDARVTNGTGYMLVNDRFIEEADDADPVTRIPVIQQYISPDRAPSTTIHVYDGTTMQFNQLLSLNVSVAWGSGTAGADAGDTAYFNLSTTDPDASYESASGTVFATSGDPFATTPPVPEPPEIALMTAGLGAFAFAQRRRTRR